MNLEYIVQVWRMYKRDRIDAMAASCAFYLLLGLAPCIVVISSILQLVWFEKYANFSFLEQITPIIPPAIYSVFTDIVSASASSTYGITIGLSSLMVCIAVYKTIRSIEQALQTIWQTQKVKQHFLYHSGSVITVATVCIGIILLSIVHLIIPLVIEYLPLSFYRAEWIIYTLNIIVFFLGTMGALMIIVQTLSGVRVPWDIQLISTGGITCFLLLGQILLTWYFHIAFTSISGIVSTVVALLLWFYYSLQVFFIGIVSTNVYVSMHKVPIAYTPGTLPVKSGKQARTSIAERVRISTKVLKVEFSLLKTLYKWYRYFRR